MQFGWNPWHGCRKFSEGCLHCYVYRIDAKIGRDAAIITRTGNFDLPLRTDRNGRYKLSPPNGTVYTCFSSDFFIEEADPWRGQAWEMMRLRTDLSFFIITKRIHRFSACIPQDWGHGYPNVHIACTIENQRQADARLPYYLDAPIVHKNIVCEPLLGPIDFGGYLEKIKPLSVGAGGESGEGARLCDFDWVLQIRDQCRQAHVPFHFRQTGACFRAKGRVYHIPRRLQFSQAKKSGAHYQPHAVENPGQDELFG